MLDNGNSNRIERCEIMKELFEIEPMDSPRRAWLKKHDVRTKKLPMCDEDEYSWAAWTGDLESHDEQNTALGTTEHDSICTLAIWNDWPLWNEETILK